MKGCPPPCLSRSSLVKIVRPLLVGSGWGHMSLRLPSHLRVFAGARTAVLTFLAYSGPWNLHCLVSLNFKKVCLHFVCVCTAMCVHLVLTWRSENNSLPSLLPGSWDPRLSSLPVTHVLIQPDISVHPLLSFSAKAASVHLWTKYFDFLLAPCTLLLTVKTLSEKHRNKQDMRKKGTALTNIDMCICWYTYVCTYTHIVYVLYMYIWYIHECINKTEHSGIM